MKKSILNSTQLCFTLFFLTCLSILLTARAQADEPDLAAWLTEHPRVSQALAWEDANGIRAYPDWSTTQKKDLYKTFHAVWSGQSLELTDPPPNMLHLEDDSWSVRTVLSEDHAWSLFIAHVSFSLAVETGRWVPWSLTEYSEELLSELLDGRRMFEWSPHYRGYVRKFDALPAPPDFTFEFLNSYLMIAQDRLTTIENLLVWSRAKMRHYSHRRNQLGRVETRVEATVATWHYRGTAPVSRMIQGTRRKGERNVKHWAAGCHGVTGFLRAVLRVVNIPVKREQYVYSRCGHAVVNFMSEGKYLSHGDDVYSQTTRSSPGYPIGELFIDQATFDAWFGPNLSREEFLNSIGRRTDELAIKYLPTAMLNARCRDFIQGNSRENSYIMNNYMGLKKIYSVAELESMNFWDRMDAKIESLGGCPIQTSWIALEPRTPTILKISGPVTSGDNLLVVEVRDNDGQPAEGHLVTFTITSDGGTLSVIRTTTDANGRAESRLTLGPDIGTTSVFASAAGVVDPVTFTAGVLATPDFDGNGTVGIPDFLQFVDHFGLSQGDTGYDARFDLDGDGIIGVEDFLIFVEDFGKTVSSN